jgi:phage repressor protein C with HTH and peptisase S24 domain
VTVCGNSMEPAIRDGDVAMIDIGRNKIRDGCVYAIGLGETIAIKRLELMTAGRVRIISDNKAEYESYEANIADVRVIGRVIWLARKFP